MVSSYGRVAATPNTSKRPFIYPRINPEFEIRILEISPPNIKDLLGSSIGGPMKCRQARLQGKFVLATLAEKPKYEALSYAWGEPDFDDEVEFPGGALQITSHLGSALRHLRRNIGCRLLWVDAICIDQSSNEEKGHQISLMASIYQNTDGVLAWLGNGSSMTAEAIYFLIGLSTTCSHHGIDAEGLAYSDTGHRLSDESLAGFNKSWFQRLWIVQEMALPHQLTLLNGTKKITAHDFMVAIFVLIQLAVEDSGLWQINLSIFQHAVDLCGMRVTTQSQEDKYEESDILDLVVSNSTRACTEPKDRINALLGLQGVRNKQKIHITPDYGLSDAGAFQQFAAKFLLQGDIRCLHYAGLIKHTCKHNTIPSWVPDWTCNQTRLRSRIGQTREYFLNPFRACNKVEPNIIFDKSDATIIGVKGVLLDFINVDVLSGGSGSKEAIGQHLRYGGDRQKEIDAIHLWNDLCTAPYKGGIRYHTGEHVEAVVARTLVLNNRQDLDYITKADSSPGAGDGMIQWMRRLTCIKQHIHPCENSKCAMLPSPDSVAEFLQVVKVVGSHRTLFTAQAGYIGLGPVPLEPGDAVAFFYGAETPFLLRKLHLDETECNPPRSKLNNENISAEHWQLVGDCYLHGFMDNEILGPDFGGKDRTFWIV